MRDDIDKLPIPGAAKRYARMKSSDLGSNWSKKTDMFSDMVASITNQSKEGFKNKDACPKVPHAMKEAAQAIVRQLLDDEEEGIQAAACLSVDGSMYTGTSHWEACMKAAADGNAWSNDDEDLGFVTTKGRFVSRNEAEMIGVRRGQVQKNIAEPGTIHAHEFTRYE